MPGGTAKPKNRPVGFYIRFVHVFFRTHHVLKIFGRAGHFCRVFFLITLKMTWRARHFGFVPGWPAWFLSGDRSLRSTPIVVCTTLRRSPRVARLVFTIQNRRRAPFFRMLRTPASVRPGNRGRVVILGARKSIFGDPRATLWPPGLSRVRFVKLSHFGGSAVGSPPGRPRNRPS